LEGGDSYPRTAWGVISVVNAAGRFDAVRWISPTRAIATCATEANGADMPLSSGMRSGMRILRYRPEIDILRAIAVLFVIAAHLGLHNMAGGYTGVDIFFVISGFLITRQVCQDIESGDFSFAAFYERRIRRIIPALYAVIFVSTLLSIMILLPSELEEFSKSALFTVVFGSNIFFWRAAGYFAEPALEMPLLHTWSLGVEEQFYIIFPLATFAFASFGKVRWVPWFAIGAAASFGLNVWSVGQYPEAAFYLPAGRAWEFLIGSILAVGRLPLVTRDIHKAGVNIAGLLLIILPFFLFDESTPFPGLAAVPSCLGAALFIWGHSDSNNKLLSLPIFEIPFFFGMISYSLYLWHWPVIVFYRKYYGISAQAHITSLETIILFVAMVGLAYGSFRFIEQPIRNRVIISTRTTLLAATGMASICIAAPAAVGILSHGFPSRVDPQVAAIAKYLDYPFGPYFRAGVCFLSQDASFSDLHDECTLIDPKKHNILIWGDSAAAGYVYGFQAAAKKYDLQILQATEAGCPPLLVPAVKLLANCRVFNSGVQSLIEQKPPDALVLSAHWQAKEQSYLIASLEILIRQGIPVFVLGAPITYIDRLPHLLAQFAASGLERFKSRDYLDNEVFDVEAKMKDQVANIPGVTFVSILNNVCARNECPPLVDGMVPLQFDRFHLTAPGSAFVVGKIAPIIAARLPPKSFY
jgi:peptidoglycan/LPS O-acetylase OafA/YrhL